MSSPLLVDILAYWNLNDDGSGGVSLVDSTPNGNTLNNINGVTLGTGIIAGDAVFNGNNYLQTSSVFSANTPISFSGWINTTSSGTWGGIGNVVGGITTGFRLIGINGDIYFQAPSQTTANTTGASYNDGNWHFCVGVADGSNISLYVDGSLITSVADSSTAVGTNFLIGNGGDFVTNPAQIDEVGVWNRALSSTEVSDLYYAGLGNTYPFTNPLPVPLTVGCKSYWNLNDNGSGGVSLVDSTGNGYSLTNNNNVTLGTGIIAGDAVFNGSNSLSFSGSSTNIGTYNLWINAPADGYALAGSGGNEWFGIQNGQLQLGWSSGNISSSAYPPANEWSMITLTLDGITVSIYYNGNLVGSASNSSTINFNTLGCFAGNIFYTGQIDEVGIWTRALSQADLTYLYNNGNGITYPFSVLYYNNAQEDGDWGNLLNWWQDAGFTSQATALPDSTTVVNLYNQVTQNTQGANQFFCHDASFWSADFGVGLTLQSTGVVNMQGTSVMAGATTDGVSMHDSSTLTDTSSVAGDVTMRDSSRANGYIGGNAYVYYDQGNGQFPIGGTVDGSVSYLDWPAVTPQWFNDNPSIDGAGDGDFSNLANWWSSNTYTTRPINAEGTQELPDASTDVFIGNGEGTISVRKNTGTPNPTVNTITANGSGIGDAALPTLSLTATNGIILNNTSILANAVIYGNVTFNTASFVFESVINGTATYTSAASLQYTWQGSANSLGNLNEGADYGSSGFVVNISGGGGGGTALGTNWISRLLHLPWFINV